jgi:hypothetical protein
MAALKKVLFNIGSASNANEDVCDKNSRLDDMILDSTVKSNRIAEKSPQKASESQETISIEGGKSPIKEPINLDLGKDFMPLFDEKYQEGEVEGGLIHKVVSQKAKEVFSSVMSNVTSDQSAPNSHNSSQTVENKQKEIETRAHEEDSLLEASNISNEVVPREEEEDMIRDDVRDDIICMIFDLPKSTKFYRGNNILT